MVMGKIHHKNGGLWAVPVGRPQVLIFSQKPELLRQKNLKKILGLNFSGKEMRLREGGILSQVTQEWTLRPMGY